MQRTGNRKEFWNATGSRDRADFSKTTGDPLRPDPAGPCRSGWTDRGRRAAGWAGSLLGSSRKPWGSQRFACTSRRAAPPAAGRACFSVQAKAEATVGGPLLPSPACGCLPPDLTLLKAQACSSAQLGRQQP